MDTEEIRKYLRDNLAISVTDVCRESSDSEYYKYITVQIFLENEVITSDSFTIYNQ